MGALAHCGTGGGRIAALPWSSTATMAGGDADTTNKTLSTQLFPQHPGEEPHAHSATQYKEAAEARLAEKGLLAVAQGEEHSSVKAIVDVDLSLLPALPATDRDYHRSAPCRFGRLHFGCYRSSVAGALAHWSFREERCDLAA